MVHYNNQLRKRAMKLESLNDKCHHCIRELLSKNCNSRTVTTELSTDNDCDFMSMLNDNHSTNDFKNKFLLDETGIDKVPAESFDNLRKGFLLESTREDRRKKLCNEMDILPKSALDNATKREILELEKDFCSC